MVPYQVETFLATLPADPTAKGLPGYVEEQFYAYLQCGILALGFLWLGGDAYPHQMLVRVNPSGSTGPPSARGGRSAS
jgi:hypothetical protein